MQYSGPVLSVVRQRSCKLDFLAPLGHGTVGHRLGAALALGNRHGHVALELDGVQVGLRRRILDGRVDLVRADDDDGEIGRVEGFVRLHAARDGLDTVLDELLHRRVNKRRLVLLQVRLGGLGPRANGHGRVLEVVPRGLRLEEVWARGVHRTDQQTHTVRPPNVHLSASLVLVGDIRHKAAGLECRAVDVAVVEALGAHVLGEAPCVRVEAGDGHAHVVVDLEQLFLVRCQLVWRALKGAEYHVRLGAEPKARAALFDGFLCVLDLE
mmetsp:Transcript_50040/g.113597  ORF Transcript_50040/g.113597 Transcript_50040/m.113597 type:complete len:268 (-) Transcript_50040:137-940(-)